jgi:putative acetyltransferase
MFTIRPERTENAAVREVNVAAFGGTIEADIVDKLRVRGAITLSLVAVDGGKIVGHILFSPVTIESAGRDAAVVGLGPVAVLPSHQKRDIGSPLNEKGPKPGGFIAAM